MPPTVGVPSHERPGAQPLPRLEEAQPREEEGAHVDPEHHLELVHLFVVCGEGGW